jgi:hypothetical protein
VSTLYLVGQRFNALSRAASIALSPVEDTNYPRAALYDDRSNEVARFSAAALNATITVDLQLLQNEGFELGAGATFTNWTPTTSGTGTIAQETVLVTSGSRAAKLNGGAAGAAQLTQTIRCRSGERLILVGALRGDGAGHAARINVFNTATGKFLDSNGAWTAGADVASVTSAAGPLTNGYTAMGIDFVVEPYSATLSDEVVLELRFFSAANGPAYFDGFIMLPAINFVSIHGHNLTTSVGTTSARTVTASDGLVSHVMTIDRPSFYTYFPAYSAQRIWTITFGGGIAPAVGLGELVLGYAQTLNRAPAHPHLGAHVVDADRAQVRISTEAGDEYVYDRSSFERRTVRVPYLTNDATTLDLIQQIHHRSENGRYPMVIVPNTAKPAVVLGRVERARSSKLAVKSADLWHQQDLAVRELAFPQFAV